MNQSDFERVKKNRQSPNIRIDENTISCIMYCRNTGCPDDLWGITAGHSFHHRNPATQERSYTKTLISALGSKATTSNICRVSQSVYHFLDEFDHGDGPKTVDMAIFPLNSSIQQSVDINIPGINSKKKIFTGNDRDLLNRRVAKHGYRTGYTEGIIKDANVTETIEGKKHYGLFVVVQSQEHDTTKFVAQSKEGREKLFADSGDSGSLIVDIENQEILGIICAVYKDWTGSALCIRLDHMLCHTKHWWYKLLSFSLRDTSYDVEPSHLLENINKHHRRMQKNVENMYSIFHTYMERQTVFQDNLLESLRKKELEVRGKQQEISKKETKERIEQKKNIGRRENKDIRSISNSHTPFKPLPANCIHNSKTAAKDKVTVYRRWPTDENELLKTLLTNTYTLPKPLPVNKYTMAVKSLPSTDITNCRTLPGNENNAEKDNISLKSLPENDNVLSSLSEKDNKAVKADPGNDNVLSSLPGKDNKALKTDPGNDNVLSSLSEKDNKALKTDPENDNVLSLLTGKDNNALKTDPGNDNVPSSLTEKDNNALKTDPGNDNVPSSLTAKDKALKTDPGNNNATARTLTGNNTVGQRTSSLNSSTAIRTLVAVDHTSPGNDNTTLQTLPANDITENTVLKPANEKTVLIKLTANDVTAIQPLQICDTYQTLPEPTKDIFERRGENQEGNFTSTKLAKNEECKGSETSQNSNGNISPWESNMQKSTDQLNISLCRQLVSYTPSKFQN